MNESQNGSSELLDVLSDVKTKVQDRLGVEEKFNKIINIFIENRF